MHIQLTEHLAGVGRKAKAIDRRLIHAAQHPARKPGGHKMVLLTSAGTSLITDGQPPVKPPKRDHPNAVNIAPRPLLSPPPLGDLRSLVRRTHTLLAVETPRRQEFKL